MQGEEIKFILTKITIRFCSEVCIGIKNNFENNVMSLKGVIATIEDDCIILSGDKNINLKIEKDIYVPMTNVASYWCDYISTVEQ